LVISLGCGSDTRYWRIGEQLWNYVELDLPKVMEIIRAILGGDIEYMTIGCSVLDEEWIDLIASKQKEQVLFLAEGLLMYLPEKDVVGLFQRLASNFSDWRQKIYGGLQKETGRI
jgi:O-methyltransferase involved in polyketide biosynthesis